MSRLITDLTTEMQVKVNKAIELCKSKGVNLMVTATLRTLEEQAVYYRQSRTIVEINAKIALFKKKGFDYLADVLEKCPPCSGKFVTNAAPGESWHNYKMAIDVVPVFGGVAQWSDPKLWNVWTSCAKEAGLFTLDFEKPHAQFYSTGNPLTGKTTSEIKVLLTKNGLL
jgi:peptidoglycan L-alanyl-D-glutamate endopeptidase CwlK